MEKGRWVHQAGKSSNFYIASKSEAKLTTDRNVKRWAFSKRDKEKLEISDFFILPREIKLGISNIWLPPFDWWIDWLFVLTTEWIEGGDFKEQKIRNLRLIFMLNISCFLLFWTLFSFRSFFAVVSVIPEKLNAFYCWT